MSHQSTLSPIELQLEYQTNPIGLDDPHLRLSWKLAIAAGHENDRGLKQTAYQIKVTRGGETLWDSGKVASDETTFIDYGGKPLAAGERADWSVCVWDAADGASDWSRPAFWEAGKCGGAWSGKWIGSLIVGGPQTEAPSPYVRKTFAAKSKVVWARLYATALGLYEFHINGQRVGQDLFTPGWSVYPKRLRYQAYDVTAMIGSGANAIGAILGDGWFCGNTGNVRRRQFWGDRPRMLAELHLRCADGSQQIIVTDSSWQVATGPILSSDWFNGETYDARLEMPGWDTAGFKADGRWQPVMTFDDYRGDIIDSIGPRVRAVKELTPIEIKKLPQGEYIIDMGQNMVGHVRVKVKGRAGQTVKMQFVEVLDEKGKPYTANLRTARQTDHYKLKGDPAGETFEPHFTFHGFRYVAMSGFPGELSADDITGVVVHSQMKQIGSFECSDPLINQLQRNIEWGQRGNFLEVPTDCPQRDERMGWLGDAQVFIGTAAFNFNVAGFFAKWMQDVRDDQSEKGEYPSIAPNNYVTEPFNADGGPAWADAGIICPWAMYQCYGDKRILAEHYDSMQRFLESMKREAEPFGMIRSHPDWKGWHGFGDWLSQDGPSIMGKTPKDLIGTAFFAYDAKLMEQIAIVLGKRTDAAKYAALAEKVTTAFRKRFVSPDGLLVGHTQTAYVLALHFDLLPESQRSAAIDALVRDIRSNADRLNTGFVGSPYINHVLTRFGRLDVAYDLLMQKQWPSWLYAVTHGATTIWERWDGWTHDRGFQDPAMNSFNHYAYGAIGAWLYQSVAGLAIDPTRPGYKHVLLNPQVRKGGPLTHAKATLNTTNGVIESGWKIDGSTLRYDVTIPPTVTATVTLPGKSNAISESGKSITTVAGVSDVRSRGDETEFHLLSGRYSLSCPW